MLLRYAILHHQGAAEPHFDLLFETAPGSTLATWRSEHWPLKGQAALLRIADHRREYLEYEGPVSGNRGHVQRVEGGPFELLANHPHAFVAGFPDTPRTLVFRRDPEEPDRWTGFEVGR